MLVRKYRHSFFVYPTTPIERQACEAYAERWAQKEQVPDPRTGIKEEKIKAIFCTHTWDRREMGFLIDMYPEFVKHMEFASPGTKMEVVNLVPSSGVSVEMTMKDHFKPRGEQPEAISYVCSNQNRPVLEAATGFGKTITAFFAMAKKSTRTAAVMGATHLKTWMNCGDEYMGMRDGDVLVISGSSNLKTAVEMISNGDLNPKFILISSQTLQKFITAYEEDFQNVHYDFTPIELWSLLGVGFLIRDETHESIHATVKQVIYSDIPEILFLSATLVSDDRFINRVYEYIFGKKKDRWISKPNQHIAVRPTFYWIHPNLLNHRSFKFKSAFGYSHVHFEKSILKRKRVTEEWCNFISSMVRSTLIKNYQSGLKALVLVSTKKMAFAMQAHLQADYPHLTVGAFVDGAHTDELYDRDIVVSTPKGAGTGKDIPGLYVVIQTIAVNSIQLNLQIMGRLRPVKVNGVALDLDPLYIYLNAMNIPKHNEYHRKRIIDVSGKCKDVQNIETHFMLGRNM